MIETRWLNNAQAAEYTAYSPSRFRKLAREYSVPRHGPEQNRYDRYELDQWMENPKCFMEQSNHNFPARRRAGGFVPIKSSLLELLNEIGEDVEIVLLKREDPELH